MKTVWVVVFRPMYEYYSDVENVAVFDSEEKANKYKNSKIYKESLRIEKWEVQ